MASATLPSTPVPGASVEARLTTMCAAPVDVQVMLLQSARGAKMLGAWELGVVGIEAARMGPPMAMMAAAMVFILSLSMEACGSQRISRA